MKWLLNFLLSSIGQKVIMSLTGIFFIIFLIIHLIGNLQLLYHDEGQAFNVYAAFMAHTLPIKIVGIGMYVMLILHAVLGISLYVKNKKAKGSKYAKSSVKNATWTSKSMVWLGFIVLIFLCLHMGDFWFKMKFTPGVLETVVYDGNEVLNLYHRVNMAYSNIFIVIIYSVGVIGLFFHLIHGFQSAFQSLGINHKKYTPLIKGIGMIYSVLICFGFLIIPIIMFLRSLS